MIDITKLVGLGFMVAILVGVGLYYIFSKPKDFVESSQ